MHSSTAPPAPPTARPSGLYHGWLVLATVATNMSVVHGFRYSFTVFYVAILMHFGWDRASTAAIGSVNLVTYGLLVAVSGAVVDRFGPRVTIPAGLVVYIIAILLSGFATELWQFYALTGLLAGAGFAFCGYVPNFVVLTNWFVRRRGLAFGVAQAGGGTSFFLAGLAQLAITWFGWRNAYWLMGAGLGIPVLLMNVLLLRRRPQEMGLEPDGKASAKADAAPVRFQVEVVDPAWVEFRWTLRAALKTKRFWSLFAANLLIWGVGFTMVAVHQAAYARDVGHSPELVALALATYGVSNMLGSLSGFMADRLPREVAYSMGASIACLGLVALLLANDPSRGWLFLGYSVLFGYGLGLVGPSMSSAHADIFQGPHFGAINGMIVVGFSTGGMVSPWLAGYIFDQLGTYVPAFALAFIAVVAACAMMWNARPSAVRRVRRVHPVPAVAADAVEEVRS